MLLDEVETLAADRSKMSMEANPVDVHRATDAVLTQLDQLAADYPQLLFLATSNFAGAIDEAFLSRADLVVTIDLPTPEACKADRARHHRPARHRPIRSSRALHSAPQIAKAATTRRRARRPAHPQGRSCPSLAHTKQIAANPETSHRRRRARRACRRAQAERTNMEKKPMSTVHGPARRLDSGPHRRRDLGKDRRDPRARSRKPGPKGAGEGRRRRPAPRSPPRRPRKPPIVVWGGGPRVRVYCVFDEDAITQDGVNEEALAEIAHRGRLEDVHPVSAGGRDLEQAPAWPPSSSPVSARSMDDDVADDEEPLAASATPLSHQSSRSSSSHEHVRPFRYLLRATR